MHEASKVVEPRPCDVPSDERAYQLYVLEKVQQGVKDIDAGRTSSTQELLREVETW